MRKDDIMVALLVIMIGVGLFGVYLLMQMEKNDYISYCTAKGKAAEDCK